MAYKFTIGRKIGLGFGVVILLTIITFILTTNTLKDSKKKTDEVVQEVTPSITALEELNLLLRRSQNLITKWYYVQSKEDEPFKVELRQLINTEYKETKEEIFKISKHWTPKEKKELNEIFALTDELFAFYQAEIMDKLNNFSSYGDTQLYFLVKIPFEEIDEKLDVIYIKMNSLILSEKLTANKVTGQMFKSFNFLQNFVKWLGIALVIGGLLVAIFTVRSIVKPVRLLKNMLNAMSKGILPKERIPVRNDEIGDMGVALTNLVGALESTTDFAHQVGSGNFGSLYEPLSEHDVLGNALIKMRHNLAENERILERKVIERTEQVVRQKEEIEEKNEQLEVLYKQVTDSIRYAKRIQEAILPPDSILREIIPHSFVFYKPKDIVSGDFYWVDKKDGKSFIAAVDCTGHGVPGAFMSIVGYNLLKDIVNNTSLNSPAAIMDVMSEGVNRTLHNKQKSITDASPTKDGMDMSMLSIDYEKMQVEYAGAFNPLYIVRDGGMHQYKADKFPIGLRITDEPRQFTNTVIPIKKGDTLYIFSDGYADQFGGPKGKKFMAGHFRSLLLELSEYDIFDQKHVLHTTLEKWMGSLEQVDDILVIGIRI